MSMPSLMATQVPSGQTRSVTLTTETLPGRRARTVCKTMLNRSTASTSVADSTLNSKAVIEIAYAYEEALEIYKRSVQRSEGYRTMLNTVQRNLGRLDK